MVRGNEAGVERGKAGVGAAWVEAGEELGVVTGNEAGIGAEIETDVETRFLRKAGVEVGADALMRAGV